MDVLRYVLAGLLGLTALGCLGISMLMFQAADPIGGVGFAVLTLFFAGGTWTMLNDGENRYR